MLRVVMSEPRKASLFGSFRLSGKKDKQAEQDFVLSSPTNVRRDSSDVIGGWKVSLCPVFCVKSQTCRFRRPGESVAPSGACKHHTHHGSR